MTRENKLAMVIGFGLLLFVGILVSDHLSARTAQLANPDTSLPMLVKAGLPGGSQAAPREFGEQINEPAAAEIASDGEHRIAIGSIDIVEPRSADAGMRAGGPINGAPAMRTHTVAKGEYPSDIAKKYYGKRALGEALAKFNDIDPSKLKIGKVLNVPPIEVLDPTLAPAPTPDFGGEPQRLVITDPDQNFGREITPEVAKYGKVTVSDGDTLYKIATRVYGDGTKWEQIVELNPGVTAKNLKRGTELRYALASN
jgi:nucleoid-associated protein YgaU